MAQTALQAIVVSKNVLDSSTTPLQLALFEADGTPKPIAKKAVAQADFAGADITALKVELNAFLAKLRTAGIVASS